MISLGSIDGRKLSGLGLEMEENELEEGEAGCFQNGGDDSTIDPDIALSYIGEKLQNVLGHFQKDFEGGVSAENLGAKFGGYGSFLPTYQRSPSWSRPRSSPEVHNYSGPRFPNNLHLEDGRENSFASTSASLSARPGATSGKTATIRDSVQRDVPTLYTHAEELTSNVGLVKKSGNPCEQRTLKVRIKVGAENLSTRQNAEIYSGLGLDVSPSSSLDDNPVVSEGLCGNNQDVPDESPTSILQIMTSFPAHGSLLLSPLSDDLIHLFEKGKLRGKSESKLVQKATLESSGMLVIGSLSSRSDQKVLDQKKWKSSEKDQAFSTQSINEKSNESPLKKETDIDISGCEELVSNALKLPLLASSQYGVGDPTKGTSKDFDISAKDVVKDQTSSGSIKKELFGSLFAQEIDRVEKYDEDLHPPDKVWESKKANFGIDSVDCPQDDVHKAEKAPFESNFCKGRKAPGAEAINPSKQLAVPKEASSNEEGVKLTPGKEQLSSGSRKKSKGIHSGGSQVSDFPKDQFMLDSSLMPKNRKSSLGNNLMSKNDSLDFKRDHGKPGDRYKDFFGDLELEEEDSESISGEIPSSGRPKDSQLVEKRSIVECHSAKKEKSDVKKIEKPSPYSAAASSMAPLSVSGPTSDATPAGVVPYDQEDWVLCDRCQQWRLLPHGKNPKSLPDKWRCRMLNWLPGMNRCSIPEEQTTKALRALYHLAPTSAPAPASESEHNPLNYPARTLLGVSSVDAKCISQDHKNIGSQDITSGKKNIGSMDVTNSTDLDDPTHFSDSQKKDIKVSGRNGVNHSPSLDAYQQLRHSSSVVVEKLKDNKKEKKSSLGGHSDRGTNSKVKNKRESDSESYRVSKKVKSDSVHFGDENWISDNGGASSKAGRSSSSGLLYNVEGTDRSKYANPKDSRGDAKKSAKNPETNKPGTSDDGLLYMSEYDHQDSVKKRKGKEHHVLPSAEQYPRDREGFVEETQESNHGKEKKTRISKSVGKDTSRIKDNVGTDKKGRGMKDQQIENAADYMKSSMGSIQPSVAANSSSSKVSGSCKNKPSVHEMKGSPVESVSSSPFRFPDADKFSSARRNPVHKDEFQDSGVLTMASPGRFWGGEDNGCDDRSGMVIKNTTRNVTHHDSLESHVLEFSNRDLSQPCDGKVKAESVTCRDFGTQHVTNVHLDCLGQGNEECQDEERTNTQNSGHQSKKSGKGYYSRSKDKTHNSRSDFEKGKNKISDSSLESVDHLHSYEEKLKSGRNKCDEKFVTPDKVDKIFISKKDSAEGILSDSGKGESQLKFGGHNGSVVRLDVTKGHDKKQKLQRDHDDENSSKKLLSGTSDLVGIEFYGRGKAHSLPPLARGQAETVASISGSKKENGEKILPVDAFENGDALKTHRQGKKAEKNGSQPFNMRHPTPEVHKGRDLEAPSPIRRDSSSHAAMNAVKEAKALKHMADRLKSSGSTESTGLYFQAALKFLHGASLLESGNSESTKHNETIQSTQMYSSTAKLCEFCAHEYEKLKDMAAAALAYKCMEVAYMKVIYSSHTSASRDRNELQNVLQIVPPGESPSSSASDVDNVNNQSTVDKAALAKGVSSPQVAGSHVITPKNRSSFTRLLNYAQDVSFAMEASRKSRLAFAAANPRLGETQHREGGNENCSLRFCLTLSTLTMEAISLLC
ncbi:CW-type domain-containing protein [Abeliophyllum distichum]|uniref:CW-type domain-containing protein n=1 Tax=Abeliophyllum distichum TaxID=126358 RepID=A0ABD1VTE6_9LAMI